MQTQRAIGLAAVVVFGGILVRLLLTHREPTVLNLPPPSYTYEPPPPIKLDPIVIPDIHVPPPLVLVDRDAGPPRPPPDAAPAAFRVSKPGAGEYSVLAFPASLPDPYTPEGFRRRFERALKDCPMGDLELVTIDCAEFPCTALTVAKDELASRANLNECAAWTDVYTHATQYLDERGEHDGKAAQYRTWTPLPPDDADAHIVMMRSTARTRRLVKAQK